MYEYSGLASELAKKGRFGDSMVMHVNPMEVKILSDQGMVTTNPHTGQPEAFLPLLLGLIPSLLSAAAPIATGIGTGLAAIPGLGGLGTALAAIPNAVGGILGTLGTAGTNALGLGTAAESAAAASAAAEAGAAASSVAGAAPGATTALGAGPWSPQVLSAAGSPTSTFGAGNAGLFNLPGTSVVPGTSPLLSSVHPATQAAQAASALAPNPGLGATAMQGIGEGIGQFFGSPSLETAGNALSSITEPLASAGEWGMANPVETALLLGGVDYLAQDDEADIYDDTVTGEPYDAAFGERVDPPPGYTPGVDPEWLYFQDRLRKMADGGIVWRGLR